MLHFTTFLSQDSIRAASVRPSLFAAARVITHHTTNRVAEELKPFSRNGLPHFTNLGPIKKILAKKLVIFEAKRVCFLLGKKVLTHDAGYILLSESI